MALNKKTKGIWEVYEEEANREIQKLLIEKGYAFSFYANREIFNTENKIKVKDDGKR
jgi:hypothetical protein